MPGKFNNYIIGGNITSAFAFGEVGSPDDFYFLGAEPLEEAPYPLLSGNIFDSNGELLFKLVRNVIVANPKNCYKIYGDYLGYEIVDNEQTLILKVETRFHKVPELPEEYYFTTIKANFYNNSKSLVLSANSGEEAEQLTAQSKMCLGVEGTSLGYSKDELTYVNFLLRSRSGVYERLTGVYENKQINLDGKCLHDAILRNCLVTMITGDFIFLGDSGIEHCTFQTGGPAHRIQQLLKGSGNLS